MLFRTPQSELRHLSELVLKDQDAEARFNAALHGVELPHTVWSVGKPPEGKDVKQHVREKRAWQRVEALKARKAS